MNRIFLIVPIVLMSACTGIPRQPVDVAMIPNDCANQIAITRWLEDVARAPRHTLQSEAQYDAHQSSVKVRLWSLRYHCNIVR